MKTTFFALAAASFVAAQDFGGQPECAVKCLQEGIPKVGCALDDTACQCDTETQSKLVGIVGPCLIKNCSAKELTEAQDAAGAACAAYSETAGADSATSPIGSATGSVTEVVTGSMTIVTVSSATGTETESASAGEATTTVTDSAAVTTSVVVTTGVVVGNNSTITKPTKTAASSGGSGSETGSGDETATGTGAPVSTQTGNAAAVPVVAGLLAMFAAALAL